MRMGLYFLVAIEKNLFDTASSHSFLLSLRRLLWMSEVLNFNILLFIICFACDRHTYGAVEGWVAGHRLSISDQVLMFARESQSTIFVKKSIAYVIKHSTESYFAFALVCPCVCERFIFLRW